MSDPIAVLNVAYKAARGEEEEAWAAFEAVPRHDDVGRVDAWCVYLAAAERADQAFRALREAHVRAAAA